MILQTAFFPLSLGISMLVIGCRLLVRLSYFTDNQLPTTHNQQPNTERKRKKAVCNIIAFRLQKLCFYNVITKLLQRNNYAIVFDDLYVCALVACVVYTFNKITPPSPIKATKPQY